MLNLLYFISSLLLMLPRRYIRQYVILLSLITSITIILSRQLIYNSTFGLVKYLFSRQNNSNIGNLEFQ